MVRKIVSGGQTGVDRSALDWALDRGIECGGWCPSGRLAEDGTIDSRFPLRETPSESYAQRTEYNVRDSDGTVIILLGSELKGGTALTRKFATSWNRPCLILSESKTDRPSTELRDFINKHRIEILNLAGPRESGEPGVGVFARRVLDESISVQAPQLS